MPVNDRIIVSPRTSHTLLKLANPTLPPPDIGTVVLKGETEPDWKTATRVGHTYEALNSWCIAKTGGILPAFTDDMRENVAYHEYATVGEVHEHTDMDIDEVREFSAIRGYPKPLVVDITGEIIGYLVEDLKRLSVESTGFRKQRKRDEAFENVSVARAAHADPQTPRTPMTHDDIAREVGRLYETWFKEANPDVGDSPER